MEFEMFISSLLCILNEMSPYIILGFIIAGLLHEFVKPSAMNRHLAGNGWKPVVKAALLGIPLPLCSCGVLPTAVGLHRQGASKGATTSFLIATPQTGVDSIAATYSLLGLPMAIMRPLAALVGGFIGGMGVTLLDKTNNAPATVTDIAEAGSCHDGGCGCRDGSCSCHGHCDGDSCEKKSLFGRILAAVKYGMVDMVASVGKWLVIGLVIAAVITVYIPDSFLLSLSDRPLIAMLAMIVIAVPMYVCATGSIPIALSLMMKGLNPGAAFVLLMAGPAANFASMMVLGKSIGRKATAIYVGSVIVTALNFGLMLDYLLPASWMAGMAGTGDICCHEEAGWFPILCSAILLAALVYSGFATRRHHHIHNNELTENISKMKKEFKIEGMSCNHCRMTVEKAIAAIPGVESVTVDLAEGKAAVEGDFSEEAVVKAVTLSGFDVK